MSNKVRYNLDESAEYKLRQMLVNKIGAKFLDQDSLYIASVEDISIMILCANEVIFGNRLPKDIPIVIVDRTTEMAKAVFMFSFNDKSFIPRIKYIREKNRDTPLFVANSIYHELIHYYDFLFGPLSKVNDKTFSNKNGKQFVGDYDSHGDYFCRFILLFKDNGIPVSIIQQDKVKVRYYMDNSELKENEKPLSLAQRAKMFYDAIKTDDLFLVEVKNDTAYVVMQ